MLHTSPNVNIQMQTPSGCPDNPFLLLLTLLHPQFDGASPVGLSIGAAATVAFLEMVHRCYCRGCVESLVLGEARSKTVGDTAGWRRWDGGAGACGFWDSGHFGGFFLKGLQKTNECIC